MQLIPAQGGNRAQRAQRTKWIQVVVLYEAQTGRIVYRQVMTTMTGGQPFPDDEIKAIARQEAAAEGHPVHLLRALVSTDPQHAVGRHRIDLETGRIISLPSCS
jgi:hypothetical protein